MKLFPLLYGLIPFFFFLVSCENTTKSKQCTDIFKTTYITVEHTNLDDFYTLRLSNKDTIRSDYYEGKEYPVLTDQYQDALANRTDSFHFIGLIEDSIVLVEPFVFSADHCHINYIRGNQRVEL